MGVFYQCIGFLATAAVALSYWQKEKPRILACQMAANLFFAIHYFLIAAYTGGASSLFQVVVLLLFFLRDRRGWSARAVALPIAAVFLLIGYVTYDGFLTILPIVGSLLSLLPFFQSKRTVIQLMGLMSALVWLVYVIAVGSYSGIVTESLLAISTLFSLFQNKET